MGGMGGEYARRQQGDDIDGDCNEWCARDGGTVVSPNIGNSKTSAGQKMPRRTILG